MALIEKLVGKIIREGRLVLLMPGGKRLEFGPGGGKTVTVRLADNKTAFAIARNPRLGLGEAYMDGRMTIEDGTILDLMELATAANPWEDASAGRKAIGKGKSRWKKLWRAKNVAKRARKNVAHHYDIGNDLYRLFLDDDMQYSCAYFTDPRNSLEQAQLDKKAHIAAKLALEPGQHVLDIGCGWGGTALFLNKVAGVRVTGVTLSEEQLKVARERAEAAGVADQVKFELIDYRHVEGQFDRIVSIGMFEHVGGAHYDEFFGKCRELLKPDGVMLLHTIGKLGKSMNAPDPFTDKYIFPGYHLPSISSMAASTEKFRLITTDIETLRLHYAYTLRHWLQRTQKAKAKIVKLYDERFYRMWEFYLSGGVVAFESGSMCNYQLQYVRDRNALPITRDYIAEVEAKYRELGAPSTKATVKAPRSRRTKEAV
ncbi:SAM-dependent methyltransferase [Sphingomonas alba]|uniref:Cyclopropane-fatty-acyl-phospholipid synthase family protein n=1 Tax=Sphingomonas alba TaxID=2908208 RepID=A0ABT0RMI9_9SPHN|nr:cyclopropane-fatty-acyl-phospholipid synthase family protein [Sphingomonas alba]MCL6683745.1 cyclopropane-fatty-acyl-phospholipid synthase family protein [Sphingomonas alba]